MLLEPLGWDVQFKQQFEEKNLDRSCAPARVVFAQREHYRVLCQYGELSAQVSGRFRYLAATRADYPATGDWVGIHFEPAMAQNEPETRNQNNPAIIHFVLDRRSLLSRKAPGEKMEEQLICANINRVFIVSGLDRDFNLRRIERYLSTVWEGGAEPIIVLNKVDLCPDLDEKLARIGEISFDIPLLCTNAVAGTGLEDMKTYLQEGQTVAFVGSSGVGKSTLINRLLHREAQVTRELRGDGKGRHATTHRELFLLPDGGMVIDNPGMREVQLWASEDRLEDTFADIEALAENCRYADCRHQGDPGCAVQKAVGDETLDPKRLASYLKQREELQRLAEEEGLSSQERYVRRRQKSKQFGKMIQQYLKDVYKTKGP